MGVLAEQEEIEQEDRDIQERVCKFMVEGNLVNMESVMLELCENVRRVFGVSEEEIAQSVALGLSGGVSKGKSGSFIFFTLDNKYVLKSVNHRESELLEKKLMLEYSKYMVEFPHSFIPRFYGFYKFSTGGHVYRVILMNNVLQTNMSITERYDLKGSTVGRAASKKEKLKYGKDTIMKDLDFNLNNRALKFSRQTKIALILQFENDIRFLKSMGVMDYSLFIGIHFYGDDWKLPPALCDVENSNEDSESGQPTNAADVIEDLPHYKNLPQENQKLTMLRSKTEIFQDFKARIKEQAMQSVDQESKAEIARRPSNQLRKSKFSNSIFKSEEGGIRARKPAGETLEEHYFMGIIDILQTYDVTKVLETGVKSIKHNKDKLSSVDPNQYGDRFLHYIKSIVQ
jgi:1-phosphatidylinositol-4-phosphate 5-kinase